MADEASEEEILWKLRAELYGGKPGEILQKARDLLGVKGHRGPSPTELEPLKQKVSELAARVARQAQTVSDWAKEQEKELRRIAEEVGNLTQRISGAVKAGGEKEEGVKKSEEEGKKEEEDLTRIYEEKDARDLA
jgi:hypothetical protein